MTENLIQKQTLIEALSTEKNSLVLQLERLEVINNVNVYLLLILFVHFSVFIIVIVLSVTLITEAKVNFSW